MLAFLSLVVHKSPPSATSQICGEANIKPAIRPSGVGQPTTHDSSCPSAPLGTSGSGPLHQPAHPPPPASSPSVPPVEPWDEEGPFKGPRIEVGLTQATLHTEAG